MHVYKNMFMYWIIYIASLFLHTSPGPRGGATCCNLFTGLCSDSYASEATGSGSAMPRGLGET